MAIAGTEIASVFARVGADVTDFNRAMKNMDKDLNTFQKGIASADKVLGTFVKVGLAAAVAGVAAFGVGLTKSVKAAADMEQQVADINAVMNLSAKEVDELNGLIQELGLDPKLKVSATEAGKAIENLAKNGLTMSEVMEGGARSAILLANATNDNFGMAADVATDIMQQFNIKAGDMAGAVDQVIGVTNASKFTLDDYSLAIAQAGGVAGAVGVEFGDFNAALAATSTSFKSGSDAGTSFKVFLQRLVPSTKPAEEAMGRLGLLTEASGNAFFDAGGEMKSMEEISGLLKGAFGQLTEAQKIEAAQTIFGTDAMRTAFALAEAGAATILEMKQIIGNTSAEEAAATRMDTFSGAMEIARGIMETLAIGIGQKFLPVLRSMVERFSELAAKHGPQIIEWAGKLADWLGRIFTKVNIVVGAISFLIANIGRLFVAFEDDSNIIGGFLKRLGMTEEQAYAVGAQIIAIKNGIVNFVQGVREALQPVINWVKENIKLKDALVTLGLILTATVLPAIVSVIGAITPLLALFGTVTLAVRALRHAWETDFGGLRTFTKSVLDKLAGWLQEYTTIWKGDWQSTIDFLTGPLGTQAIRFLFTSNIPAWIANMVREAKYFFLRLRNDVVDTWKEIAHQSRTAWVELVNETTNKLIHLRGEIERILGDIYEKAYVIWRRIRNETLVIVNEWKRELEERWQSLVDWFTNNPLIQKGRDWLQGLWDGVREKWNQFKSWWDGIWMNLKNAWMNFWGIHSPSTVMYGFGEDLMSGLQGGVEDGSAGVVGAMQSVSAEIDRVMQEHATAIIDYQQQLKISFADTIRARQEAMAHDRQQLEDYTRFIEQKAQKQIDAWEATARAALDAKLAAGGVLTPDGSHVIMPPSSTPQPSKPSLADAWGSMLFKQALLKDTGNMGAFSDFATFLKDVGGAFTGAGMVGAGTTGLVSQIESSVANNASSATIIALLEKLVLAVQSGGLGARFQIGGLDTSGDSLSDLRGLVQYLNALYG
jgi:TP901 family phage tail tape measure protein